MAKTIEELQAEITTLQATNKELQDKLTALVDKHAKLDEEHTRVTKVLALSEADKVALNEKMDLATKEAERYKTDIAALQKTVDEITVSLRKEAEEWSVRLNGTNHNSELFQKEIQALTISELKAKIEGLQKQVKEKFPNGRHSASGPEGSGPNEQITYPDRPVHDRPELYKIG